MSPAPTTDALASPAIDGVDIIMPMSTTLELPPPADAPTLSPEPPKGGAGSPELAKMTPNGRVYHDPLPWCPLLGQLGISEADFELGAEFGSVTTLLNYLPKDRLVKWSARMAAECAARYWWVLDSFGEFIAVDYWKRAGERYRDMAGERGTLVHDVAEDGESIIHATADELLAGQGVPERFLQDANVAPYVLALQKFFRDWPGIRPIWTEVTVFSRTWGYAGTLDLICWLPGVGLIILDWKGMPLDTPIPTPTGWSTMGELRVGDQVLGSDGKPCNVTAKSQVHVDRPCYRLHFDDGTSIDADNVHLWEVLSGPMHRAKVQVLSTEQLFASVKGADGQAQHRILNAAPLQLPTDDFPVDPYCLGAWLGDGTRGKSHITIRHGQEGIVQEFERAGYSIRRGDTAVGAKCSPWGISGGFGTDLRAAGVWYRKHVPAEYLRGSTEQRLALLQGLMDTDGYWNELRNSVTYDTTDRGLAEAVQELAVSLGFRARVREMSHAGNRWTGGKSYAVWRVAFRPHGGLNPFRHTVAAEKVAALKDSVRARQRVIQRIERIESVPTQCIAVDSPNHLYLAGRQMVPTHNTSRLLQAKFAIQLAAYRHADYGIVDGRRVPLPKVEGAAIVHLMPGEDGEGAYELVPCEADAECVADVFPAMHAVKRHDHPSKLRKAITPADLETAAAAPPKLRVVTPEEVAAEFAAADRAKLEALCVDPVEQVRIDRVTHRRWQLDFAVDVIRGIGAVKRSTTADPLLVVEAERIDRVLAEWVAESGLRSFSDPAMADPDQFEAQVQELVDGLSRAAAKLALPFGTPQPPVLDWQAILADTVDEQCEAIATGLIVEGPDGRLVPAPRRPQLDRLTVTIARRGRSADPDEWQRPRDPDLVEFEDGLIARLSALAPDQLGELNRWARAVGVPNLQQRVASRQQLEAVAAKLDELHAELQDRKDRYRKIVAPFCQGDLQAAVGPMMSLLDVEADALDRLTDDQLAAVGVMVDAAVAGVVGCAVDTWYVEADEATVLGWFEGSKSKCLAAARAVAERLGIPKPKNSGEAAKHPVLVAHLAVEEIARSAA